MGQLHHLPLPKVPNASGHDRCPNAFENLGGWQWCICALIWLELCSSCSLEQNNGEARLRFAEQQWAKKDAERDAALKAKDQQMANLLLENSKQKLQAVELEKSLRKTATQIKDEQARTSIDNAKLKEQIQELDVQLQGMRRAVLEKDKQYSETTTAELRKWEEEEAARQQEIQRQLAEAEAARQQDATEAATATRLQQQQVEASQNPTMDLARDEATYARLLRRQHFQETEEQEEPTDEERDKEGTAVLMETLLYTCTWQQCELLAMRQVLIRHETTLKAMDKRIATLQTENSTLHAANSQQRTLNHQLQADVSMGLAQLSAAASTGSAAVDCRPALAAQAKQLEERINHLVASLGDTSKFAGALTVSNQLQTLSDRVDQRPAAATKEWKMPNFKIEKFDDYHKTDPLQWWMTFNAEADHQTHHQRMPRQGQGECQTFKLGKLSTTGSATTSLPNPSESAALLAASLTSGDDAVVASSRIEYEHYAVELVPLLNQPLHVQDSSACAVVPPSDNEPVASPALLLEDPSTWASLEDLDPLTVEEFQWLPLPSTGSLPTPHCNALMAHLREYLHAAVPPPSTDDGVAVVDLYNYLAKIDREYTTQQYVDNDAPLLYIRIQIGKATCSALIDCGATRNYISQDFMARAGLGPRVRRKSQPTHATLADGHTQKSIDRCVDSVPVYFAPLACEAVSFDILDNKFDMILGMSWLQSEDHPVNFHGRTVHVRDRCGELVPCTVPLPHPLIGCHVVSVASIRQSIRRNDIEEMGICFLHALSPGDQPKTDTSDPRIIELLDSYEDVFQAPAGVIPDRPMRHGITLEDGAVPPRGCIYRMSEEELQVLRAQLDDLLAKGWIRPSCSPYGAPVLFVRKKNKDLRLCIDYRKLNAQTIKNAGPLPRIDDLLERLGGSKYFSKLDLKSRYHQIEIQPRDRYKTAFKTRYGHFEWIVMPFGVTNAPATFQAVMMTEFRDLLDRTVLIYLDDILVYSRPLDEHLEHLRAVLERLRIAKYKANRDKCELAQQELEYLGHYVTLQGIRPLADKVQAIQDWLDLKCTTDVRSFLDLASYYMRFVKGFQRIAAPLLRLQSSLEPFEFSDEARHAFHTLKTTLLQVPALSIYETTTRYCPPNHGVPEDIVSDRDTRFMSAFWTTLMVESSTSMKSSSARSPQTDGQMERAHQIAQMMFRTLIRLDQKDWVDRLPDIEFAYNTSVHPAIGVTPFELHHDGRKRRIFADILIPRAADIDAACSPASTRKYRELLAKARTNMQEAHVRMQQQANRRRIPCPIRADDLVWVTSEEFALEQDVSHKLLPKWFGLWMVTSTAGDDPAGPSFIIEIPPHLTVHPIFHASKLAVYTLASAADFPGRRSQDPLLQWMVIRRSTAFSHIASMATSRCITKFHLSNAIRTTHAGFQELT
ncbi:hypothetical protein CBR_g45979 [Chara braunii]|uniref:Reverse transcriptase domain-containing protein n=1 Tax=Chara braunii TaxID=69332 RepID=A0A388M010_CHABU|nr:hypothetical protein CBR_g45979 [Chara braunii]|eukprot:GBG87823.1 hypothetical protein CBR_g45979 [Chara braunii]